MNSSFDGADGVGASVAAADATRTVTEDLVPELPYQYALPTGLVMTAADGVGRCGM